ncbi:hypothetical protein ABIE51_001972 [Lysobacter sp. OAE881]
MIQPLFRATPPRRTLLAADLSGGPARAFDRAAHCR